MIDTHYLTAMHKMSRMTREQQATASPKELVEGHLMLVVSIAKRCNYGTNGLLDCIQDGNEGLVRAANAFNPSLGYSFTIVAALRIKTYILIGKNRMGRSVKISDHLSRHYKEAKKLVTEGVPPHKICTLLGIKQNSLDILLNHCSESDYEFTSKAPSIEDQVADQQRAEEVQRILKPSEVELMVKRLQGWTCKELSAKEGILNVTMSSRINYALRKINGLQ